MLERGRLTLRKEPPFRPRTCESLSVVIAERSILSWPNSKRSSQRSVPRSPEARAASFAILSLIPLLHPNREEHCRTEREAGKLVHPLVQGTYREGRDGPLRKWLVRRGYGAENGI